jgi:dihydrofolate reductase
MTKIQLFIATTLDGFIARENGSLDWLFELPNPNQIDHGYNDFMKEIDIIIMGRKTYNEVMGFGIDWPYSNCKTYIVTKDEKYIVKTENTFLLHTINNEVIMNLKSESQKNIWLVGGGDLITQFLDENAIDEMTLCMIPMILGNGIRLFPNQPKETKFEFISSEAFETGIVNLTYRKRRS